MSAKSAWMRITAGLALALLTACAKPQKTIQQEGKQTWDAYRASVKYELAKAELDKGNIEQAKTLALEIGGLSPDQPRHVELLARTYVAAGDFNAAKQALENGLRVHPQDAGLQYMMGTVHERAQEWTPAAECFRAAVTADPNNLDYCIALAQATARGDKAEAGVAVLEAVGARFKSEPAYHLACAELHRMASDLEGACVAYQRALQAGADGNATREALGMCLYWRERYDEARDYLAPAAVAASAAPAVMAAYARCLVMTGQSAEAAKWLERVTADRPQHAALWLLLAEARWKTAERPAAIDAARRATQVDPASGEAQMVLAVMCLGAERLEQAASAACRAVDLGTKTADAYILLGRIYESRGDKHTARDMYRAALGVEPGNATAGDLLGRVSRVN